MYRGWFVTLVLGAAVAKTWDDMSYVIQIHSTASNMFNNDPILPDPVIMTAANGKTFECYLPQLKTMVETKEKDLSPESLLEFGRMAAKDMDTCVQWIQDLWQYEICPNALVRKVQKKVSEGSESHEVFDLGNYEGDVVQETKSYAVFRPQEYATQIERVSKSQPLYSQRFGRHVMVQYLCGKQDEAVGYNFDADSQEYSFLVASPVFCAPSSVNSNDMSSIMGPLQKEKLCIKKNEGWWTYEFCFGLKIRQYHREQSGDVTLEYNLGEFDHAKNAALQKRGSEFTAEYLDGTHERARVAYVQEFSGGTPCDETSGSRHSRVLFYCNTASPNHYILSVKELQTCSYEVKISTPSVCKHPNFLNEMEETQDSSRAVHCVPQE